MMDAEVERICRTVSGEISPDRVNSRNGCRREWAPGWDGGADDPKLRQDFRALVAVSCYQ
jgi:hypothetical protein